MSAEERVGPIDSSARRILAELRKTVVGQETAIRDLATLLAMHSEWFSKPDDDHTAPNALIIGPTGVGKTHAIRRAAQNLNIPLAVVDATQLGGVGAGPNLDDILLELLTTSRRLMKEKKLPAGSLNDDGLTYLDELKVASRGIVFIDEFDKLATRSKQTNERNELIQRRLLQFIDGASVTLNPSPEANDEEVTFNTAGLMFVVAGAFTGLTDDVGARPQPRARALDDPNQIIPDDLVRFGFMKELIARIPVIIVFEELGTADLVEILRNPAIDPSLFYRRYLKSLGADLVIDDSALARIAADAADLGIGARGLHQRLFPLLARLGQQVEDDPVRSVVLDQPKIDALDQELEQRRLDR
ncbi:MULTISPECIES: AAA family ATPase [Streptomyces]|uniref:AAA family ATPase n=1 Tax=Streptomyces TaxID=1883 RepID=UPI002119BAA2|nr:AAA family ATPase [Streptomyces hilarionis]MCQ9135544.1 AAA family ATPase [Streptomyces hilarionis]